MKIYTSYFGQLKNIPDDIVQISICAKAPPFYKGLQYKKLAPKYGFFMQWKKDHNNEAYIIAYDAEVLNLLDVQEVYKELEELSGGKDVVLLCYELPNDFCHRHLDRKWFQKAGIDSIEWSK